jgi:hypothetical protein
MNLVYTIFLTAGWTWFAMALTCPRSIARRQLGDLGGYAMRLLGLNKQP